MASTSEVGHAKNIAHLNLLNTHIAALGTTYHPTNNKIRLAVLQNLCATATGHQDAVNNLIGPYVLAVDAREDIFAPLNKNLTRLSKAYKSTEGVTSAHMDDLKTIIRKIKGERSPATTTTTQTPDQPTTQHSTSQMSYDQRTNNMGLLISLLQNTPNYAPNETEYTVAAYQDKKADMLLKTQAVADAYIPLTIARTTRNRTLYSAPDNLVDSGNTAKDYITIILDKTDPQYKAIAAIKFKKQFNQP